MADFAPAPIKPLTEVRTLAAIDIRVGTIQAVAEAPGSRKLVKLTVDFGSVSRQILAGLKTERAEPREIEGRQALLIVNLRPREMAEETSEGMLFDLGYDDGDRSGAGCARAPGAQWHPSGVAPAVAPRRGVR